jgi:cobalt-zinc-cadmium efflux system protein
MSGGHRHHGSTHGHAHAHGHVANERRAGIAAVLTGLLMLAEVVGGIAAGSLALLADAGHMLADCASLALAWLAFRLARRPADWKRTYGFDRFSVLVAFVNGLALFVVAGWIVIEAADRLRHPVPVEGGLMLWVAVAGLLVNLVALWILRRGDAPSNLNMRAATLHVVGDLLGSVATIAAAIIILTTGATAADPILSVLVAVIILRAAFDVVRESGHILLESTPAGLDVRVLKADLEGHIAEVVDVHHVHAWSITEERPMITLHARVSDNAAPDAVAAKIKDRLKVQFGIGHATVEVEHGACKDAG